MLSPEEYTELGELLAILGRRYPDWSIQGIIYQAQKVYRPSMLSQGGLFKSLDHEILDALRKYAKKP